MSCAVQMGVGVTVGDGCLVSSSIASFVVSVSFSSTCDASFFQLLDSFFALRSLVVCIVLGFLKYDVPLRLSCVVPCFRMVRIGVPWIILTLHLLVALDSKGAFHCFTGSGVMYSASSMFNVAVPSCLFLM